MKHKKSLQELTVKDNFMFGAVMLDPENCRETLERCLGIKIERVEVDKEKSIVYNPEFKGVRLDIYAVVFHIIYNFMLHIIYHRFRNCHSGFSTLFNPNYAY